MFFLRLQRYIKKANFQNIFNKIHIFSAKVREENHIRYIRIGFLREKTKINRKLDQKFPKIIQNGE